MEWGAEQIALAIAGALFLCAVVATLHPRLSLSLPSRIVLSAAAGTYVAAAMGFQRVESSAAMPLLWIVPLSVAVVVTRDVVIRHQLRSVHLSWGRRLHGSVGHEADAAAVANQTPSQADDDLATAEQAVNPTTSSAELEQLAYTNPDARLAIALRDDTPSSVLSWIASHGDAAVVDAIAARQESSGARAGESGAQPFSTAVSRSTTTGT